ncbi:MAG: hypothetical protein D6722_11075 [Bacteroidetes bacterium]|nr:MAG: hypothetical protein D6722_11075 [Bacteroidota bacterium]
MGVGLSLRGILYLKIQKKRARNIEDCENSPSIHRAHPAPIRKSGLGFRPKIKCKNLIIRYIQQYYQAFLRKEVGREK